MCLTCSCTNGSLPFSAPSPEKRGTNVRRVSIPRSCDHVYWSVGGARACADARLLQQEKKNPSGLSPYVYLVAVVRNWWGGWSGGVFHCDVTLDSLSTAVNRSCVWGCDTSKEKSSSKRTLCYSIQWVNTMITACMYCAAEYYSPSVVSRYISGCIVAKCSLYLCTPSRVDAIDPRTVWADKERLQLSVPSLHWHGNHKRIIIYLLVTWNRGVKVLS